MGILPTDAINALPYPAAAANLSATPSEIECEVMNLFEQFRSPLSSRSSGTCNYANLGETFAAGFFAWRIILL
jgi:hypothetical protein